MKEKVYFTSKVEPNDYIAHGIKELYCEVTKKNVKIDMILKRPKLMNNIYNGWRPQKSRCSNCENCKSSDCKYFKDFKIKEQD